MAPSAPSTHNASSPFRTETEALFASLWADYTAFNPQAKKIYDILLAHEKEANPSATALVNDHVALRTYNHPRVGEAVLAAPFLKLGYERKGEYFFEQKKLYARHYEAPTTDLPKVFISELKLEECSDLVRGVANEIVDSLSDAEIRSPKFLFSRRSWKVSHATYEKLLAESEYAAWLYAFGYRANHFTVSFNHMKSFASLEKLDDFIKAKKFALNTSGGEIKGTPAQLLEQSSTLAEPTQVEFTEGVREIPACYYEFARRYPMANGELYQGFIAASADKIFESTNVRR